MAVVLPSDISGLFGWFKAGSDCYTDAGKLTPCTNGDLVYTWANKVVGGNDLVQSTSGSRPTYNAAYSAGSLLTPYVSSAGDKSMTFNLLSTVSQPYSIVMCFRHVGRQDTYACASYCAGANAGQIAFQSGADNYPYIFAGTVLTSTIAMTNTTPQVVCGVFNGTSSTIRVSGKSGYSGSTSVGTGACTTSLSIFGDNGLNYTTKADLYEVMYYSKALSLTEQQDLENYLNYTHGLLVNSEGGGTRRLDTGVPGRASRWQGINLSLISSLKHDGPHSSLRAGVAKSATEGNPSAPCLEVGVCGSYRFRWPVTSGAHTIQVDAKQVSNVTGKRPKLVVKANSDVGVDDDIEESAAAGTGWVTIGPVDVTTDADGVLWVELHNVDTDTIYSPAFFDNIQVT